MQRYKVRYPVGFKTTISPGRSVQIYSNSQHTYKGPVAIDLFCSLIFSLSVTGIQLCKVIAYFPVVSRHLPITSINNYASAHLYTIQQVRRFRFFQTSAWFCSPSWLLQHSEQKLVIRGFSRHLFCLRNTVRSLLIRARRNRACWLDQTA